MYNIALICGEQIIYYENNNIYEAINEKQLLDRKWYIFYTDKYNLNLDAIYIISLAKIINNETIFSCGEYTLNINYLNKEIILTPMTSLNQSIFTYIQQFINNKFMILYTDLNYKVIYNLLFRCRYYFILFISIIFIILLSNRTYVFFIHSNNEQILQNILNNIK